MKADYMILGAGISGLACAKELKEAGKDVIIFEAEDHLGGLCHSFMIDGFCFDSAVHLSFTENKNTRLFFNKTPYQIHNPISYNWYSSLWIKHPLLNNMYSLDAIEKAECIRSFVEREEFSEIKNYGQWLRASYGDEIAKRFYYVYTDKYWTVAPERLSTTWVGSRLNSPDLHKILMGAFTEQTGNDYYAREMRYPIDMGFQTFLKPISDVEVNLKKKAIQINLNENWVKFSDGTRCYYNKLISSIPLPVLIEAICDPPLKIKECAKKLAATKISLVSIGFNKPDIPKWLWFYIYDKDIMAARVNSPSIKSCKNIPNEKCSSLQFEIYHNPNDTINPEQIIENTRYALRKMNLCNEDDIIFMDYRFLPFGNVIFELGMEGNRDICKNYLKSNGVELIGRFGEWDYLWSDQSFLSGMQMGKKLVSL